MLIPPAQRRPRLTGGKSGAPFGNHNAYKHGRRTRERRALFAAIRVHIHQGRELVKEFTDRQKSNVIPGERGSRSERAREVDPGPNQIAKAIIPALPS